MVSVKGPRSALSDYLEEKGIKVERKEKKEEKIKIVTKRQTRKIIKFSKPKELCNAENTEENIKKANNYALHINFDFAKILEKEKISEFIDYLCVNRFMNQNYFNYFAQICDETLIIPDCSEITDYKIEKSYKKIIFGFCGQLKEVQLNKFIEKCPDLEELCISGAFLIKRFNLPKNLKSLNISDCSNLKDDFIDSLNESCSKLKELNIDRCLKLQNCVLKNRLTKLSMNKTFLGLEFLKNQKVENFTYFSARNCKNLKGIEKFCFQNAKFLDFSELDFFEKLIIFEKNEKIVMENCCVKLIEFDGVKDDAFDSLKDIILENKNSEIDDIKNNGLIDKIERFNGNKKLIKSLNNIQSFKLTHLSLSGCDINDEELNKIFFLKNLKELNLSWIKINDEFVLKLIEFLNLNILWVFGCFDLTEEIAKLAYTSEDKLKIIGCPAETAFLLKK